MTLSPSGSVMAREEQKLDGWYVGSLTLADFGLTPADRGDGGLYLDFAPQQMVVTPYVRRSEGQRFLPMHDLQDR